MMTTQRHHYPAFSLVLISTIIVYMTTNFIVVDAYDWTCNLFCYNDGICRHGHGKFGSYTGDGESTIDELAFEKEFHDNGMYCTCPVGYTGLQCEIKYVVCGRDDHTCFNGSACVKERASNSGKVFYRCECDAKESIMDAPYAHKYCEHIATVFCDGGDGFTHGTSYCTNGGKCKNHDENSISKHIGCICPDEWEGDYCEIKIENIASLTTELIHEVEENLTVGEIVAIIIGIGIGIGLLYYFKGSLFRRFRRTSTTASNNNANASANGINSNKGGRGRRGRRGRSKGMELSSSSTAAAAADGRNDNTRDII